jgi:hypothetical protein
MTMRRRDRLLQRGWAAGLCFVAGLVTADAATARPRALLADEATGLAAVGWFGPGPLPRASAGGCTAVLVAPDLVLTAAHCMTHDETRPPDQPRAFVFAPGWPEAGGGKVFRVEAVTLTPPRVLLQGALPYDLVLVRLGRPVPQDVARPLPLAPAALPQGLAQPPDGAAATPDAAQIAAPDPSLLPAVAVAMGYPHATPETPVLNETCALVASDGPVLGFGCRAQGGFSGGPVLVRVGAGWQVLAITVARGAKPSEPGVPPSPVGLYAVIPAPALVAGLPQP